MKYIKFLFSGTFMGILLLVFAAAVGYATFIENDYDATTAKALVFNTQWFELLLLLMVVNFTGMIFTMKLYLKSHLNILVIHLALIIIIGGAGVTRFSGYEGQLHIRKGQSTNRFISSETYFNLKLKRNTDSVLYSREIMLSQKDNNILSEQVKINGGEVEFSLDEYYPNASEVLVRSDSGSSYINLTVGGSDGRHDIYLKRGSAVTVHDFGISFGDSTETDFVQIIENEGKLFMRLPALVIKASAFKENKLPAGFFPVELMSVHTIFSTSFVIKEYIESAVMRYARAENKNATGSQVAKLNINGNPCFAVLGKEQKFPLGDLEATVYIGNKVRDLPFSIKLNAFTLERYPGSNSPSSFASDVQVIDERNSENFRYQIYMNHILNYDGYRFFQTSYDQDEMGTILTVNHDFWGTWITYFGYFLLIVSLLISFVTSKTRFKRILFQINETHSQRKSAALLTLLLIISLSSPTLGQNVADEHSVVSKEHAAIFGHLLIQDREGRIVPVNTMSQKYLVKIYKKDSYKELTSDQFFLDLILNGTQWQKEPLVKVNDQSIQSTLGISKDYASFADFLDEKGFYKLKHQVELANAKSPAARNAFDKELINVDERANILYMLLNGAYLNIFPLPNDPNDKWVTPDDYAKSTGNKTEVKLFYDYLLKLKESKTTDKYSEATALLEEIRIFQRKQAKDIVPSQRKINLEIFYNEINIFKRLFPFYFIFGAMIIGIFLLQTFRPRLKFTVVRNILFGILFLLFLIHSYGLGLRWYISGHEPWSNGYESMLYISWAVILAGFIFMKASYASLGLTSLLSGITLLTAHMGWMNPEITNLVPVLKSYWLTIHVATITASYGFLALGCMMGFLNLCIMIFRDERNKERLNLTLKELTLIVELALVVGLVLLVIGNCLGAIWANESWGRYWGWDPKESWTLVSIIVYALILHLRLIPSIRNVFTFNFFAVLGFATILMTYFGVNFYLSGLHSYAGGDPVPVPDFVFYTLAILAIVGLLAGRNHLIIKDAGGVLNNV